VSFADPDDPAHEIRADLTWLLSHWACIFGRGCRGVNAQRPGDACCTHGAYFVDADDERRVRAEARLLTPELWERHGTRRLFVTDELDGEPARKTAVVDEVCVFFNRDESSAAYGCALHHLATRTGRHFMATKPEVCWQVPLRREWEDLSEAEGRGAARFTGRTTLGEFSREAWGEGGADLSWWCSSAHSAHAAGSRPIVVTYETELRELIGDAAYDVLREYCDQRLAQGGPVAVLPLTEA
jgi:hypothetical protein